MQQGGEEVFRGEVGSPCLQRKAVPFLSEPRSVVRASVACAARPGALFLLVSEGHVGASISAKVLTDGWEHPHFSGARSILLPSLGDPPHGVGNGNRIFGVENSLSLFIFLSLPVLVSLCLSVALSFSACFLFSPSRSPPSLCFFFLVAEQLSPGL